MFFAYIGFDAISTAAEEQRIHSASCPSASLADSRSGTLIYVTIGGSRTKWFPIVLGTAADLPRSRRRRVLRALPRSLHSAPCSRWPRYCSCSNTDSRASSSPWPETKLFPRWAAKISGKNQGAVRNDARYRNSRGPMVADRRRRRNVRSHQHRNAVRVRARLYRCAGASALKSPTGRVHFVSLGPGSCARRRNSVRDHCWRFADACCYPVRCLAGDRPRIVFHVRLGRLSDSGDGVPPVAAVRLKSIALSNLDRTEGYAADNR